jgi:DNA repair exonuclease SbcCD ATPase subunit
MSGALLLCAGTASGQTAPPDLQTVLGEVRQLRQELKNNLATIQRTNILLYRLQLQDAAVGRAQQRLDDAHAKVAELQSVHKNIDGAIKNTEEARTNAKSAGEQDNLQTSLVRLRVRLDAMAQDESDRQSKVADFEQQLRVEQAKLSELQDGLDQIDRALKAQ